MREAGVAEDVGVEGALVPEVVQGEHGLCLVKEAVPPKGSAHHQRQQARLPVVDVGDVGGEAQVLTDLEGAIRQHDELQVFVGGVAVQRRAVKQGRAVDEVDGHRRARHRRRQDGDPHGLVAQGDRHVVGDDLKGPSRHPHAGIQRHHDPHVMAKAEQLAWQRARDVAETAAFGEGDDFG